MFKFYIVGLFFVCNTLTAQLSIINLVLPESGKKKHKATHRITMHVPYRYDAQVHSSMRAYIDGYDLQDNNYSSLFTDADIKNKTINTSLPVGVVKGQVAVSPTGGANYTIPIETPPGSNGFVPDISINYNSHSTNGMLGVGWDIQGLSRISRSPRNIYLNGEMEPVKLDNSDNFSLDGSALIVTNGGTNGGSGTMYGTEQESFSRVTSYGSSGQGPEWFKVETKEGLTMEYGNSSDSKVKSSNGTVITWRINKMHDLNGNYILYKYSNGGGESKIEKIQYTGNSNAGVLPYNEIEFWYQEREDRSEYYIAGNRLANNNLIKSIRVSSESSLVREYKFNYGYDIHSYLKEVTEHAGETRLNSTTFKYGQKAEQEVVINEANYRNGLPMGGNNSKDWVFQTADFNGDGLTDLLGLHLTKIAIGATTYGHYDQLKIFLNNNKGNSSGFIPGPSISAAPIVGALKQYYSNFPLPLPGVTFMFGDLNGDSKDDIVVGVENGDKTEMKYSACLSSGTSGGTYFSWSGTTIDMPNLITSNITSLHAATLGDFDGDGRKEFFGIFTTNNSYFITSFDSRINLSKLRGGTANTIAKNPTVVTTDYDGDGTTELIYKYDILNSTAKISLDFTIKNGAIQEHSFIPTIQQNTILGNPENRFVDFNGDGMQDLVEIVGPLMVLWKSKGYQSGIPFSDACYEKVNMTGVVPYASGKTFFVDINNDTKTDVVSVVGSVISMSIIKGLSDDFETYTLQGNQYWDQNTYVTFADFYGDGDLEIYGKIPLNGDPDFIKIQPKGSSNLRRLDKIKNGYDITTEIVYSTIARQDNYQLSSSFSGSDQISSYGSSLPLVTNINEYDRYGRMNQSEYSFQNAILHKQGKGFLGFEKTSSVNKTLGLKTESEFSVQNNFFTPILMFQRVYNIMNGSENLITTKQYSTIPVSVGGDRFWTKTTGISTVNHNLSSTVTSESFIYDGYGNILRSSKSIGNVETESVISIYGQFGTWIPSSATNRTITLSRAGEVNISRTDKFEYYATTGNLKNIIQDYGHAKSVAKQYTYDSFGNPTGISISASNVPTIVTSSEFDSKGRFAVKNTNALGQTTSSNFDNYFGKALSLTDINGNTASYNYDNFGRLISSVSPLGIPSTTSYQWDLGSGGVSSDPVVVSDHIVKLITQTSSFPKEETWYDSYGRVRKKEKQGFNDKVITVQSYNDQGKTKTATAAYSPGSGHAPITSTYSYDDLSRFESISNDAGSTIYTYTVNNGELKTEVVSNPSGQSFYTIVDITGKIIEANDNGGNLTYKYYSDGNQKSIALDGDILVDMEYDIQGNQEQLNDKNSGLTLYQYDPYGRLVSQTDAKNNVYTLKYDLMGKVTEKSGPDGITNYEYVTAGNGLNKLERVTAPNGSYDEYEYDKYSREISLTRSVDSELFTSQMSYDNFGKLSTLTYPSGLKIIKGYDNNGYLKNISDFTSGTMLYTVNSQNHNGQVTSYTMGNGITTNNSYSRFGALNSTTSGIIQDLSYDFNPENGNLLSRTDHIAQLTEIYTYDQLNRLETYETATLAGVYPKTEMEYDGNGNISKKSDIGTYDYDPNKINAVTEIIPLTGQEPISTLQQDISYTPFSKVGVMTEGDYELTFAYGHDRERNKTTLKNSGNTVRTKYFGSSYEKIVEGSNVTEVSYIPYGDNNIVYVKENGVGEFFYTYKDHLGSPLLVTDDLGVVISQQSFDAWGRRRNPNTWQFNNIPIVPNWLRGYTSHEHLPEFSLINMNGRVYDPVIGRVLCPDNYVQNPTGTQGYNRYSYVWNNPLKFHDPSGDFVLTALALGYFIFFTEVGYELQKQVSPIAGTYQRGGGSEGRRSGVEFSVGLPKALPVSVRWHYGTTLYDNSYDGGVHGQTSYWGVETTIAGVFSISTYNYESFSSEGTLTSQSTAKASIGGPWKNLSYENDWQSNYLGDGGDRYRSAALQYRFGSLFNVGFNIFTGDPGFEPIQRKLDVAPGTDKSEEKSVYTGGNVDEYRSGILYFGIDGVGKIGGNSEIIRHVIQNRFAHDILMGGESAHIKVLDRPSETFYYFGTGTGSSLW